MSYFHEALRGAVESGKRVARATWSAGTYLYYDAENSRISKWTGGHGGWNDPDSSTGSGTAYTFPMTDIIVSATGLPVNDWQFVG